MAHERLGHADEARQWLDKAAGWIEQAGKGLPKETRFALPLPSWSDRLEAQILRREADRQAMIVGCVGSAAFSLRRASGASRRRPDTPYKKKLSFFPDKPPLESALLERG
jgi:hypothetical protein